MVTIECSDCGKPIPPNDENSLKYGTCFKCRCVGVGVTFRGGGGYGRENFSARTNAEFIRENDGPQTVSRK